MVIICMDVDQKLKSLQYNSIGNSGCKAGCTVMCPVAINKNHCVTYDCVLHDRLVVLRCRDFWRIHQMRQLLRNEHIFSSCTHAHVAVVCKKSCIDSKPIESTVTSNSHLPQFTFSDLHGTFYPCVLYGSHSQDVCPGMGHFLDCVGVY